MQTIVITGASTGIGLATTKTALEKGYTVFATARNQDDLDSLEKIGAIAVELELCDEASIQKAATLIAEYLEQKQLSLNALFNNAGYGLQVAMEDLNSSALREQLETNLVGPLSFTNAILPLLSSGSKIIFNSSILGVITIPFRGPYCISKFALEAAADAYRLELESAGISVHVIQPGPIEAKFRANALKKMHECLKGKKTRLNYKNHIARLEAETLTEGTLPASDVAKIVIDIIENRNKRSRNLVTRVAKTAAIAKRLLGHNFHKLALKAEPITMNLDS